MAWDFSTEPEFAGSSSTGCATSCARRSGRSRRSPTTSTRTSSTARIAPLQEQVKERGPVGRAPPPELGGQGFGQVKLGLMHEILGTLAARAERVRQPGAGLRQQRDPRARRHGRAEGALADPLLAGDLQLGVLDDRARDRRLGPDAAAARAPCATATSGSSTATSGSRRTRSIADFLIVMAVTDPDARPHQRASMFIVPADTPGVDIVRDVPTMEHP